jgi:hypothetical protein
MFLYWKIALILGCQKTIILHEYLKIHETFYFQKQLFWDFEVKIWMASNSNLLICINFLLFVCTLINFIWEIDQIDLCAANWCYRKFSLFTFSVSKIFVFKVFLQDKREKNWRWLGLTSKECLKNNFFFENIFFGTEIVLNLKRGRLRLWLINPRGPRPWRLGHFKVKNLKTRLREGWGPECNPIFAIF